MGYFSNGEEGERYQAEYCERCLHDVNQDCPILLIHLLFNYDQHRDENLKTVLDAFIPWDGIYNGECKMFIENTDDSGGG